ncbi:microfibrillar-associated protein 2-like [Protopterus annectens]|uniref:microfibrillar-associated protein 2-like n=1 Tax=Protopterus annectens TaxID=7888 RepID=UPI001CFA541B|nr:microfibrillar-associated protein 2-like [Protopterus annectens]
MDHKALLFMSLLMPVLFVKHVTSQELRGDDDPNGEIDEAITHGPRPLTPAPEESTDQLPQDCREEQYPCTRLYSVHQPRKQCMNYQCFYSLRRMYIINKEVCFRVVCEQEERLLAEKCRERAGWPRRLQRSVKDRSIVAAKQAATDSKE